MTAKDRWLLPEGIEEVLPTEARAVEDARRRLLDLFDSWGYELVMPPLVEYLDAILTGVGSDLDLQTFKVTDQLTGKMMGIRPDMTPQAARIDAHFLKRDVPVRLCYLGPVLRTRPEEVGGSREPLQLGAEIFGHGGPESDAEILCLMAATLRMSGVQNPHIDLGHVGVFRGLIAGAGLDKERESALFDALQRKSQPEAKSILSESGIDGGTGGMILSLLDLNGDIDVLRQAKESLRKAPAVVGEALDYLATVAGIANRRSEGLQLYFDLAELSGYGYYTGVVFSAFLPGHGRAVAKGGRYDGIGKAFGRARPATGFSADLRLLLKVANRDRKDLDCILAPWLDDAALMKTIEQLRADGERVLVQLPGAEADAEQMNCTRVLEKKGGKWVVVKSKAETGQP